MDRMVVFSILCYILSGCASSGPPPVLPADHPANPLAAEAAFIPPPNLFSVVETSEPAQQPEAASQDERQQDGGQRGHGPAHSGGAP